MLLCFRGLVIGSAFELFLAVETFFIVVAVDAFVVDIFSFEVVFDFQHSGSGPEDYAGFVAV